MFCKGYDAFTALIKLPPALCSQVFIWRNGWPLQSCQGHRCHCSLLARSVSKSTTERKQVLILFPEGLNFASALCSLLWTKGLESAHFAQELAVESSSAGWSVWITASPSELQSQVFYPNYKWKSENCSHYSSSLTACYISLQSTYGKKRYTGEKAA